jgi:hypothetical protein
MQIEFSPEVALQLEAITVQTKGMEFSGFGFVDIQGDIFYVYEFVLLDIGSTGWTEIPAEKLVPLYDRPDSKRMKLWLHRHPVGNGVPGRHNWSDTDERTCRLEPLGVPLGMQDSVRWSLAAVRTPGGWVGRYDTYGKNGQTVHIPVVPAMAQEVSGLISDIKEEKRRAKFQKVRELTPFVKWEGDGWEGWQEDDYEKWLSEVEEQGLDEEEIEMIQTYFWGGFEE